MQTLSLDTQSGNSQIHSDGFCHHQNIPEFENLMVGMGVLIRNGKHLEEKSKILDVVGILIVVDGEPVHGMGGRITVANNAVVLARWDKDGGGEGTGSLWRNKAELIVSLHVLLLELIEILDTVKAKLFEVFLDVIGDIIGDVRFSSLSFPAGGDEIIGFS